MVAVASTASARACTKATKGRPEPSDDVSTRTQGGICKSCAAGAEAEAEAEAEAGSVDSHHAPVSSEELARISGTLPLSDARLAKNVTVQVWLPSSPGALLVTPTASTEGKDSRAACTWAEVALAGMDAVEARPREREKKPPRKLLDLVLTTSARTPPAPPTADPALDRAERWLVEWLPMLRVGNSASAPRNVTSQDSDGWRVEL
jgi:hypothetical protein